MAANVSYGGKDKNEKLIYCSVCTGRDEKVTSHSTFDCTVYPTPSSKRDRLTALKGCLKCGNTSHETSQCQYRFNKRCYFCNQFHFSFLCTKKNDNTGKDQSTSNLKLETKNAATDASKKEKFKKEVSTGTTWVGGASVALFSQMGEDSILPTFSFTLKNNYVLRGMRDSGCQPSFISDKVADQLQLETIKSNFPLTVHGFNSDEEYLTRVVKVHIKEGESPITAICIPSIRTELRLPGLSRVVEMFIEKGYKMADEFLLESNNEISNLDFILGNFDAQILPEHSVTFGSPRVSMFSETPEGIVLFGSIERMLSNKIYLQKKETTVGLVSAITENSSKEETEDLADKSNWEPHYEILKENGQISEKELEKATTDILNTQYQDLMSYDKIAYEENTTEVNQELINYVLNNTTRDKEGRLIMPLLWNGKVSDFLGTNFSLSKQILRANLKKLQKRENCLKMIDDVFRDQTREGIIERIEDLPSFIESHPAHSFLPHMGVFKLDRESTKCRVVYLSNLCEVNSLKPLTVSHNQAMLSGPNLNKKISTSILQLRFDSQLLCFDIRKAFLNIALNSVDQCRLLFLWYRNVERGDFSIIGFQSKRLAFGLRCSPTILILALYKILIVDSDNDDHNLKELKRLVYDLIYMDNGAISANDLPSLNWAYEKVNSKFNPYKFSLQQFVTNNSLLQERIDEHLTEKTPEKVKLFGLMWDRKSDTLSTKPLNLNGDAVTKRQVLSSIASNFDLFQYNGPILNRARLFIHQLQCNKNLAWDDEISVECIREWKNIAKQVNATPEMPIKRFVGKRSSEYRLIAFTDASKLIYGAVIFIQDLNTNQLSFLLARNRMINRQLETKSIPTLEFQAISLGVETLVDIYKELTSDSCVIPIKIVELNLFSDSMVSLHWIDSYVNKMDKMNKRSVFVMNRLDYIYKLWEIVPINFGFIAGLENPADCVTRALSYKQLKQSNFHSGPKLIHNLKDSNHCVEDVIRIRVPNPLAKLDLRHDMELTKVTVKVENIGTEQVIPLEKYSSFHRLVSISRLVIKFINNIKLIMKTKDPVRYKNLEVLDYAKGNLYAVASSQIIFRDQVLHFPDIFNFMKSKKKTLKNMPNLIGQLNLFQDENGLLRVRSKFERWKTNDNYIFPLLLAKHSILTQLIISDMHIRFAHAGCYSLLTELRKQFYVPHYFTVVKKFLKACIVCRRLHARTVQLNQSSYRDFRLSPPNIPFKYLFLDHLGPYWVKNNSGKVKVWILCITCLWSRAINLKVCLDLTVKEFLRTFQLHIFEYGIPELVLSDMGSQLVAGANIITDFLKDTETQIYMEKENIKPMKFEQYFKGCNSLGSLVESCVKLTKRLLYGAIRNTVLDLVDFEFVVAQTVSLVNKRPVAFKETLRENNDNVIPSPITPEMLLKGHELIALNIIPELHSLADLEDPEWKLNPITHVKTSYSKLAKVRKGLIESYHSEFLAQLTNQAINVKDRYKPVTHKKLEKGDIVLVKENYMKSANYPMGVIQGVFSNILGEVTSAIVRKGKNREIIKRHVSSLIPLMKHEDVSTEVRNVEETTLQHPLEKGVIKRRKKAIESQQITKKLIEDGMV